MLTIWIIPFPVMVFSYFPVLVNEKSNLQIRIGYFAFLPSLDISENPTKKQGKPKFNPTWIFDFFSSGWSRLLVSIPLKLANEVRLCLPGFT